MAGCVLCPLSLILGPPSIIRAPPQGTTGHQARADSPAPGSPGHVVSPPRAGPRPPPPAPPPHPGGPALPAGGAGPPPPPPPPHPPPHPRVEGRRRAGPPAQ